MRSEKGFALVEILMSLALVGIVAIGLLSGLATSFKAVAVSDERVIAESLAKSQLEYLKVQDYIAVADYDPGNPEKRYEPVDIPQDLVDKGYGIDISPPQTVVSPGEEEWFELQSITVVIEQNGEEILTISIYKAGKAI
jgi:prepilin-type N-terminal cleavage/methylation domain-containing protein